MPYTDDGLWIPRDRDKPKTWLKRHLPWLTLQTLGTLVSIPVSLSALFLSIRGYELNNKSLVTGQRAYLSIIKGEVFARANDSDPKSTFVRLECKFVLQNLGNTPATLLPPKLTWYTPKGWEDSEARMWIVPELINPDDYWGEHPKRETPDIDRKAFDKYSQASKLLVASELGPKLEMAVSLPTVWNIDAYQPPKFDPKMKAGDWLMTLRPLLLVGELDYKDVFGVPHSVNWCWMPKVRIFDDPYPDDCTQNDIDRFLLFGVKHNPAYIAPRPFVDDKKMKSLIRP